MYYNFIALNPRADGWNGFPPQMHENGSYAAEVAGMHDCLDCLCPFPLGDSLLQLFVSVLRAGDSNAVDFGLPAHGMTPMFGLR